MDYTQEELKKEFERRTVVRRDVKQVGIIYKLPNGTFTTEDPDPIQWSFFWGGILALMLILAVFVGF